MISQTFAIALLSHGRHASISHLIRKFNDVKKTSFRTVFLPLDEFPGPMLLVLGLSSSLCLAPSHHPDKVNTFSIRPLNNGGDRHLKISCCTQITFPKN